jgi:hypothetical protein
MHVLLSACSLPAAASLNEQQVLQLFKAAAKSDGVHAALQAEAGVADDDEFDDQDAAVIMLMPLAGRLTEQDVLKLLQMAVHHRWAVLAVLVGLCAGRTAGWHLGRVLRVC